jgi:hypothetical protein
VGGVGGPQVPKQDIREGSEGGLADRSLRPLLHARIPHERHAGIRRFVFRALRLPGVSSTTRLGMHVCVRFGVQREGRRVRETGRGRERGVK